MSNKTLAALAAILLGAPALSGCLFAAGAAGGAVAADEANENDGEFDPGEDVIDDITDDEDGVDG